MRLLQDRRQHVADRDVVEHQILRIAFGVNQVEFHRAFFGNAACVNHASGGKGGALHQVMLSSGGNRVGKEKLAGANSNCAGNRVDDARVMAPLAR